MRTGSIPKGLLKDPPDVGEFGLEDFVTFRLLVLARALDRQAKRTYGESFGLSLVEWRIMAMIGMMGKATVNRLAQRMDYDKAQISRAVAGLVKCGHLRRARNTQDTRSANLVLTPRGSTLHAELIAFGRERQRALLSVLTSTERRQLYDIMGVLMKHLARQEAPNEAKTLPEPA